MVFNRSNQEYFVIWASSFVDSNFNIVKVENRGQFVSADGTAMGNSFVVFEMGVNIRKIVHNRINNEYVVLYSIVESAGTQSKLFAQRLDSRGTLMGTAVQINFLSGTQVIGADLTHDFKSNRYIVTWDASSTEPSHVRFQILKPTLQKVGAIKSVSNERSIQPRPLVAYDSRKGRFLIVWKGSTDLKVRSVNSKGIMAANVTSLGKRGNRAVSYNPITGDLILAYFKSNRGLYLARIDQNLKLIGNDFLASCQLDHRVAFAPINVLFNEVKNEFFVNWSYIDISPKSWDIYGQRIRGTPVQGSCP